VRALISEHGLNPAQIAATGPKGNLTKEDVLAFIARNGGHNVKDIAHTQTTQRAISTTPTMPTMGTTSQPDRTKGFVPQAAAGAAPAGPAVPTPATAGEGETRVEMSKLRQTIAQRLVQAQHTTASLTTFNEIDMSAVMALREKYKEKFEKTYAIGLGFMSFFAKAVISALKALPNVNASIEGTAVVQRKFVNLGVAVSTERGLMVPVLRNAEKMSMATIESEIKRLATKAREGKIAPDDMSGGTFTVTNGGVFGSLLSTPILNPPQSGILGMHKIEKRAVVVTEGGEDKIVIRPMMYVALTYDHRVIDGQQSVTFLVKVKEALEDPARLLLEI
jgi:2-oxoglutarate dehydrogenase E2 component (dihydrolipoamide succinyltransferase)